MKFSRIKMKNTVLVYSVDHVGETYGIVIVGIAQHTT